MEEAMREVDFWAGQLVKKRISRREFLGRAAALGLSVSAASMLLARHGIAQEAKRGGFARFGLPHGSTTDSIDPGTWPDTFTQCVFFGAMMNNLTEVAADGQVQGELAESFEPDNGATRWVFRLRNGITFHNGKDLTADDVLESIRYHTGDDSKSAAKSLLAGIKDMKSDGPGLVVFELMEGNADFPFLMSDYHLPIFPAKKGGGIDMDAKVGTGPFILEKFEPGVNAKLKRNPNYHKDGKPYFDEVEFLALRDVSARMNALISGEVHYIANCDLKSLPQLQSIPELQILETTGYGHYTFAMNTKAAPFDNQDVRNALKYAIDRQAIVDKVLYGHATPGNDNPIAPSIRYAINPEPIHSYDPEKAKFHLKKAGLSSLKVDLSVANAAFEGAVDAALLYQDSAKAAGIDINVVREPEDGYWDNVWMKKPWSAVYWSGRATCDWMLSTTYAEGAAWNDTNWSNARFNELLKAARGETDDKKRADMYAEMQTLVHTDGGAIVLVFNNYVSAHAKNLKYGKVAANWDNDGLKIAERWWFD
jgi:peptide/nickel transport system substrate-binding protein